MKKFVIRFILFTLFACILPFTFIAWRYELFSKVNEMSLTGWGIIGILIIAIFCFYVLNAIKKGMPYSMFTQIVDGIIKVEMPLILIYLLLSNIQATIDLFLQCMVCIIICEAIAIPINPLPKWIKENLKGEDKK